MRKTTVILGIIILISSSSCTKTETADLAITNVTVIDATGASAQARATVLITDNRISRIRKTQKVKVAKGVQTIDGSDKFLIPGLWDMHVHPSEHKDDLVLFIANGVIGVRIMGGWPELHKWREEICSGELIGPRMIIASPVANGPRPGYDDSSAISNEDEGRQFVREVKKEGSDFVKVLSYLPRGPYLAIVDEAKKQGIPVAGHIPYSVSAAEASDVGQQSIEHKYAVLIPCSSREEELGKELMELVPTPRVRVKLYADVDYSEQKAAELFARFVKNHTFVCPTLIVWNELSFRNTEELANDPRLKYVRSGNLNMWKRYGNYMTDSEILANLRTMCLKSLDIVGAMRRAGVELLAGTDTGMPYCFWGFGLHDELALFVQAGLSPLEALRTATYNAAKFFGQLDTMGTIEEGKVADLVLLDANPLEDIRNTQKIAAVVVDGKLFQKTELQKMLAQVEAAAEKSKNK